MSKTKLMLGDNIQSLKKLPDNSVDSIVTDPPYALTSIKKRFGKEGSAPAQYGTDGAYQRASKGFMGKEWDAEVPTVEFWREVYRVLKPGGHVLSFGGTRTYHRMAVNIEDAGFEIRDQIMWLYGSGFPKSHNIGKAVQKLSGDIEVIGKAKGAGTPGNTYINTDLKSEIDLIRIDNEWEGWGTSLKPANEPICVARKPLSEKSVAENVLKWGTGGINIDGCRVGTETISVHNAPKGTFAGGDEDRGSDTNSYREHEGRFPANIILDEIAGELLDEQSGISKSRTKYPEVGLDNLPMNHYEETKIKHTAGREQTKEGFTDKGGASRYFQQIKGGGTEDFFIYKENNIILWNIKSLTTKEYNTEENIEASDALKQARESICQKPELYGNNTTAQYLMTTISITKMKTNSIMNLTILNAYTKTTIGNFTLMIDEKQSHLLMEENILNVQIVSNQNALVSSIKTNQEVLVPIVSYVLEENLKSGETIIENTITNTTENIKSDRFFYQAKVSKAERNMGLDEFDEEDITDGSTRTNEETGRAFGANRPSKKNTHPTVKPVSLMAYLCRLVTPPNGIVLDPFMGSGSTGIAARLEGFRFLGMEMDKDYFKIAESRIENFEQYRKFIK